jgi:hypothetical protein
VIDRDQVVAAAAARAGVDPAEVASGIPSWSEPLDVLVRSANDEARLNAVGELILGDQLVKPLANRFTVDAWHREHPGLADTAVESPVFILGLPRTGTTLLSYLLDADPDNRSLRRWEAFDAVPPPALTAPADGDPRIGVARVEMDALYAASPEFKAIHYESAEGPTECVTVLAGDYRSMQYETLANLPAYGEWSDRCDHATAYAHHRRTLQVLQSQAPGRWVLKSPVHNLALADLLGTYPDATLVVTHRDPARVVVSLANLVRVLSGLGTDVDWNAYLGRRWRRLVGLMLQRQGDVRDRLGEAAPNAGRFVDLDYGALAADPVGTVVGLYDRLGWPVTDTARQGMERYARDNPQHRHGTSDYRAADFGLVPQDLADEFAAYRDRYDVAPETAD